MSRDNRAHHEFRIHRRLLPERDLLGVGVCSASRAPGTVVDTLILHACYLAPTIQGALADDEALGRIERGNEKLARELAAAWRASQGSRADVFQSARIEERALAALIMARRGLEGFGPFSVDSICDLFEFYGVSAHYLIDREGGVHELVSPDRIAFHAGASKMPRPDDARVGVNEFSVGVEFLATPESGYTDAQYVAAGQLTRGLMARYPLRNFYGHADVSPGRKSDPAGFDWRRFARDAGVNTDGHHLPFVSS